MSKDLMNYEKRLQNAMLQVVYDVLLLASKQGLLQKHHFYISFLTSYPGVIISEDLKEEYNDEMTIVLQHEFWDLSIKNGTFSVTLCFNSSQENITIPFNSITNFVDPSVKFGLQFNPNYTDESDDAPQVNTQSKKLQSTQKDKKVQHSNSKVVSLDSFRKK
ncbi:MAG: SspB family protein [Alphaproteobacteria bacterium]